MEKTTRAYKATLAYTIQAVGKTDETAAYFGTGYIPVLKERAATRSLTDIVAAAIDRSLIVGVKPSAAAEIAKGVMEQVYEELSNAEGVKFGDFFTARLYLHGQTDAAGTLDDENTLDVTLITGPEWDIDRSDFKLTFAGAGDLPRIELVNSDVAGSVKNVLQRNQPFNIVGEKLVDASGASTAKLVVGETEHALAITQTVGAELVACTWPQGVISAGKATVRIVRADGNFAEKSVEIV